MSDHVEEERRVNARRADAEHESGAMKAKLQQYGQTQGTAFADARDNRSHPAEQRASKIPEAVTTNKAERADASEHPVHQKKSAHHLQ